VRKIGLVLGALIGVAVFEQPSSAQSFPFQIFERTIESLRSEAAIPGLSGVILQDGRVVWAWAGGKQNIEGAIDARPDTPYVIGALTQSLGATLLLRKCIDQSHAEVSDAVVRWNPTYPEPSTTIVNLLSHVAPDGAFRYDPSRLSALAEVVEQCANERFAPLLAEEVFDRLAMINSVPGHALGTPTPQDREVFDAARLARYGDIVRRLAVPYRVMNGRATRNTDLVPSRLEFGRGLVASALDLAQFDSAFDTGILLAPATRVQALSQVFAAGRPLPTGLGWFVQAYNGEPVAWQFGVVDAAYSSLIVKIPNRRLTMILLANSDGLSRPFTLEAGDVTTSLFAKTFLKTFVP
jgi:CubicO group peptidase (beta-lactamase class C family)